MKFKNVKSLILMEELIIWTSYQGCNVCTNDNFIVYSADEETEYDEYEVLTISGRGDCRLHVYLKGDKDE